MNCKKWIVTGVPRVLLAFGFALTFASLQADDSSDVLAAETPSSSGNAIASEKENPLVNFPEFLKLSAEVAEYRTSRKVPLDRFLKMQKQPDTIILDTRSRRNFERKHIAGAVHLDFSELTKADLARVIPSKNTRILIYCNNNFVDNSKFLPSKLPSLALNIPTFVTLYGYGYRNVFELGEALSESDPRINFATQGPGDDDR